MADKEARFLSIREEKSEWLIHEDRIAGWLARDTTPPRYTAEEKFKRYEDSMKVRYAEDDSKTIDDFEDDPERTPRVSVTVSYGPAEFQPRRDCSNNIVGGDLEHQTTTLEFEGATLDDWREHLEWVGQPRPLTDGERHLQRMQDEGW